MIDVNLVLYFVLNQIQCTIIGLTFLIFLGHILTAYGCIVPACCEYLYYATSCLFHAVCIHK
jgi:hypothetical protein